MASPGRVALLLLLLSAAACRQPDSPPNIVLITVDTLRADRLGCYGSRTARTPNIDRLAAEGLLFDRAVAPLPETRPSHYTIFTSLYPNAHGVVSNAAPAADGVLTLASVLAEAGYATGGVGGCALFDVAAGEALGFAFFDGPNEPQRGAGEVVPAALDWLAGRDRGKPGRARPFFLWLHLFDPHMPYEPPPPFDRASESPPSVSLPSFTWPRLLAIAARHDGDLPLPALERARQLYDGEVEHVDHWLGRFFDGLRARGLYDETVIALTSDHGECFENGVFFDHSQCLGEGAIKVPLILRYPSRLAEGREAVGRVARAVEHLDVAPTLLRLASVPVPARFAGHSLLQRHEADSPYVFFQQPLYRRLDVANRQEVLDQLRSVAGEPTRAVFGDRLPLGARRGDWKYLRSGEAEVLYNLAEDPAESVDLTERHPEVTRELRHAVWQWAREHPFELGDTGELDPKLVERLEALGYL